MESKKIYNFYHIYADGKWEEPVSEYFKMLKESGLYSRLDGLFIGFVGSFENQARVYQYLQNQNIEFKMVANSQTGWEQETQDALYRFSLEHDGCVLYSHTKGASDPSAINISWRRSMTYHSVWKWAEAVRLLGDYGAVGCHWLTPQKWPAQVTSPFFGGTFWWTSLEHIRTLGKPGRVNRWGAESWIGEKPVKAFDQCPGWPDHKLFKHGPLTYDFVHVPKAAGNSFLEVITEKGIITNRGHRRAITLGHPSVAITRNPYDRLVSSYFFLKKGGFGSRLELALQKMVSKYKDFREFVLSIERDKLMWLIVHLMPMTYWLCDNGGKMATDLVFKLENVGEIDQFLQDLGHSKKLSDVKVNASTHDNWESYYDEEMKAVVQKIYAKDFELFGYEK